MTMDGRQAKYGDCAAVYVATGKRFMDEAKVSVRSLREQMPDLKTVLHTDARVDLPDFTQVELLTNPQFREIDKVHCYKNVAEPRLLFLDTDTMIAQPLFELFDLLNRFDIVVSHAPWRLSWDKKTKEPWRIAGIPDSFVEPNTGVVGFRNIPSVHRLFVRWAELYDEHKKQGAVMHDQPAFRQALWESDLSCYLMAPEHNCRLKFPSFVSGGVKIIHARFRDMNGVVSRINQDEGLRIFDPYSKRVLTDATFRKLNKGVRRVLFKLLQ